MVFLNTLSLSLSLSYFENNSCKLYVNYYVFFGGGGEIHLRLQIIHQFNFMHNFFLMRLWISSSIPLWQQKFCTIVSTRTIGGWRNGLELHRETGEERRGGCTVARASRALFSFLEWSGLDPLCKASAEEKRSEWTGMIRTTSACKTENKRKKQDPLLCMYVCAL